MRLFRKKTSDGAAGATSGRSGAYEVGILFDIDELGGGFYGRQAYQILFRALDPVRLNGCSFHDGDTNATLSGRERHYCIAVRSADQQQVDYVRTTVSTLTDDGLPATDRRFAEGHVTSREPLVPAGAVDPRGKLVVRPDDMIQKRWAEGTQWTVVTK